jgi:aminoglycoside phosphotransferase (APT) family kinase protein
MAGTWQVRAMEPIGAKLAEGRDSQIFEHGPGRVLRLARDGRSLVLEAEVMTYVRDRGYPAPAVYDAGEGYLVMQRLEGPTMLEAALKRPSALAECGRLLAGLHRQLHEIPALPGLPQVDVAGDRLLHRDLHPLNVLMTEGGPIVIDWANAARGDPSYDVADTWVLFATAEAPGGLSKQIMAAIGRRIFLKHFLAALDARSARQAIPVVVRDRLANRNMTEAEKARMRRMAKRFSGR